MMAFGDSHQQMLGEGWACIESYDNMFYFQNNRICWVLFLLTDFIACSSVLLASASGSNENTQLHLDVLKKKMQQRPSFAHYPRKLFYHDAGSSGAGISRCRL